MSESEVILTPTDSSMFEGYYYDEQHWTLTLKFRGAGLIKCYQELPPELFEEFLSAESKGRFFNANIAKKFETMVITEGVTVAEAPVSAETNAHEVPPSNAGNITVEMLQTAFASEVVGGVDTAPDDEADPTLELATTDTHGESLPPIEPPKTVTDALRLLSETGLIQATVEQNVRIAKTASEIVVKDAESYERAGNEAVFLTSVLDRTTGFLGPIKTILYQPYILAQQKLKDAVTPLEDVKKVLSRRRMDWQNEQERIRAEKQRQAQAEADRKAEEERKAASVQLTIGEIDNALANGDEKLAEALLDKPIEVPGTYQPPVHIESEVPKTAGVSRRAKWAIEVTNFDDMILSVAEGICSVRDGKGLQGHAPSNFLKANETAIRQLAQGQQKAFQYPGIRAWDEGSEAIRRKK